MTDENEDENFYACPHCGATFDDPDSRDAHVFEQHMDLVEQKLREISELAQEHRQTIQEWKDEKKKELLLKIATENPRLLHEIQVSPHADEMLDKMVAEDLFKRALRTETLSSFDAMWLRHPRFEEIYRASREKPEHQPQTGDSTGQSEEYFEIPKSPEAEKVLEKETPINRVSFRHGKLILEPLSKDSFEELSNKDKSLMILYSLLRKKKKD